jgi:parvulin-like peptidyl-prolyl isomerase
MRTKLVATVAATAIGLAGVATVVPALAATGSATASKPPAAPGSGGFALAGHGGADLATAASILGMTEADLRTALRSGKTLAQVGADHNVTVDTLVSALVNAATSRITQAVTTGKITQDQADKILPTLTTRITGQVTATRSAHQKNPVTKKVPKAATKTHKITRRVSSR